MKKLENLYDLIVDLQQELEGKVALSYGNWYGDVKALAATYELQDYLANEIERKKQNT